MKLILLFVSALLFQNNAVAAPQWWNQLYSPNSNTQITLKDENNNDVTAITNPTTANVKVTGNTSVQPPSLVIQATATLPTAVLGAVCDKTKNTLGMDAAHVTLLLCNSANVWTSNLSQGAITSSSTITANNLQVNSASTLGTACTPNGLIARNATGLILSCQSGSWQVAQLTGPQGATGATGSTGATGATGATGPQGPAGNSAGGYLRVNTAASGWVCTQPNPLTGGCSCPSGYTAITVYSLGGANGGIGAICY